MAVGGETMGSGSGRSLTLNEMLDRLTPEEREAVRERLNRMVVVPEDPNEPGRRKPLEPENDAVAPRALPA